MTMNKVNHLPGTFILNMHLVHNYQHITSTIPSELRIFTIRVPDAVQVRRISAQQIRAKKSTPTYTNDPASHGAETAALPAFEKQKKKPAAKAKTKQPTNRNTQPRRQSSPPAPSLLTSTQSATPPASTSVAMQPPGWPPPQPTLTMPLDPYFLRHSVPYALPPAGIGPWAPAHQHGFMPVHQHYYRYPVSQYGPQAGPSQQHGVPPQDNPFHMS